MTNVADHLGGITPTATGEIKRKQIGRRTQEANACCLRRMRETELFLRSLQGKLGALRDNSMMLIELTASEARKGYPYNPEVSTGTSMGSVPAVERQPCVRRNRRKKTKKTGTGDVSKLRDGGIVANPSTVQENCTSGPRNGGCCEENGGLPDAAAYDGDEAGEGCGTNGNPELLPTRWSEKEKKNCFH